LVAFSTALLVLWLTCATGSQVFAQCPMCGKSAEYAGATPGEANRTLATAAVVLLAPTFAIMGGVAALLWRYRSQERPEDESAGDQPDSGSANRSH
jgi:hypothetical protein